MIIESIDIRHFGKLSDFKATFDSSFNLIEGPAESGKTTLAAFIVYMLYGFPPEEKTALSERKRRLTWESGEAAGSMVFSAEGTRYRVTRASQMTEDGFRDTYLLENLDTEIPENGGISPGERFLGVDRASFADTAFLSDVYRGSPDTEKTAAAIENILFSGAERISTARAKEALEQAAHTLSSEDGKSGGVAVLEKERDLLKERLAQNTEKERLHFQREEELFVTRKKIDEARAEVEKFSRLETNYYNATLIDDYDRLHALEDSSDEREKNIRAHEDAYRAAGFLPDASYLTSLIEAKTETVAAMRERENALSALEQLPDEAAVINEDERVLVACVEETAGEQGLRESAKKHLHKFRMTLSFGVVCAVLAIAAFVGFFVTFSAGKNAAIFGALFIIILGGCAVCTVECLAAHRRLAALYASCHATKREDFLLNLQRAKEAKLKLNHAKEERARAEDRLHTAKERLLLTTKNLSDLFARWGASYDSEGEIEDQVNRLLQRAADYRAQSERLRAEHKAAENEVRALREKLADKNEVAVRARVAPDDRKRYGNQNVGDLHRGLELYTSRLAELYKTERELTDALASEEKTENLSALAERIMMLDIRISALRERRRALLLARDAVAGGEDRLRKEVAPRLTLDACRFLYEMTDGKYSDITVGDDLCLSYDEGEGNRTVAYLSHSTEDLVYTALRLSLLGIMYKEMPPVCFDGCTARQDDERSLFFLQALRSFCEEGKQCFFFTAGGREVSYAEQVFSSYRHIKMPR